MKTYLSYAIITSLLSILLVLSINIDFYLYLVFAMLLLSFFVLNYCVCKNKKFFITFVSVLSINLIVFLSKKYSDGFRVAFDLQDKLYIGYVFILLVVLIISLFDRFKPKERVHKNLFSEREYDLNRLIAYLDSFDIIGIDAHWGDGKSFLFKLLQKEYKNDFYFITIGVLSVTVDTIEKFVVDEINNILEKNGIFSTASSKINNFVKQPFFHDLGHLFINSNSYTELFNVLSEDVQRLKRPILITFEDIDRINSAETVYKIFALSDRLGSENIKILYQYDESELLKILGTKKLYLEKYIPYTIELTPIRFKRIVSELLKENEYKNIVFKDFDFLGGKLFIPWEIKKNLGINFDLELDIHGFSIRKIQIFLQEINNALENEEFQNFKRQVITFFFIKHFMYSIYENLTVAKTFLDTCTFKYKKNEYSIYELFKKYASGDFTDDDISNSIRNKNNRDILALICYFDYQFSLTKKSDASQNEDTVYAIQTESVSDIQDKQTNEKIDRLIWNLLCNGKSEYTDFENAVSIMKDLVLNLPEEKQEQGYSDFLKKLYHSDFKKFDNVTIFRLGVSNAHSVFQAFRVYEQNPDVWIKLIDFYFRHNDIKDITASLLQVLNYCYISNKKVYFFVLKKFNKLNIKGNLNNTKSFRKFFILYTEAFSHLKYINTRELNYISEDVSHKFDVDFVKEEIIQKFIQDFNELCEAIPLEQAKDEIQLMIAFLEKNIKLIEAEKSLDEYKGGIKSGISMKSSTDKIIEEFKEKNLTEEQLLKELKEGYESGKYSAYEVAAVWNELSG